jgi:hypothetical protein
MKLLRKSICFGFLTWAAGGSLWAAQGILDYNRFMRDIEPIITTTTFTSPGPGAMTCVSCHGDTSNVAYSSFPIVIGQSRNNFTEVARRVQVDDPDTSLILVKPLAVAAGGVPHGLLGNDAGEQFPNTQDRFYSTIQQWIVDATRSNVGARVSKSEAHPNPFRFYTDIVYFLTTPAIEVEVTLFAMDGHTLRRFPGTTRVGANAVRWDGRDEDLEPLPTGLYIYSIRARFEDGTYIHKGSCVYTP